MISSLIREIHHIRLDDTERVVMARFFYEYLI